jgi:DNA ligase (NAD+)
MKLISIPTNCPVCNSTLELVTDQLFCRNKSCDARVAKKIEHFAKTLKIKGLGPVTIEKLGLSSLEEIYHLDKGLVEMDLGTKLAAKLLEEIEASKTSDFATVLSGMGIPLIGSTAAGKLASVGVNGFEEISEVSCKSAGLGEKATANLQDWLYYEYPEIKEFLPFKFERFVSKPVGNKGIVCISGKLSSFSTKSKAAEALIAKGYTVTDNLSKTVNFLVDEENKGSSKRVKAESYGIPIVSDLNSFLSQL